MTYEEGEPRRPAVEVLPSAKSEGSSVELIATGNGKADNGDEREYDVENNGRGLEAREKLGTVRAEQTTEEEDTGVEAESGAYAGRKALVDHRAGGEEDACAGPCEGGDGSNVTEE
jgi:hypothetical protein